LNGISTIASSSRYRPAVPRRGVALVWIAIVMIVLVGFLGLAFDWGYAYYTSQKLQNAADAAALAGAQRVWESHGWARSRAQDFASANEAGGYAVQLDDNNANIDTGDIVIGTYDPDTRTFTPTEDRTKANAVHVDAKRTEGSVNGPLPLVWGGLFGNDSAKFHRWAIAVAEGGPHNADIIALNRTEKQSFYLAGNANLDLGLGVVQVDSTHVDAATFQGSITFIAGAVDMVATEYETRGRPELSNISMNTDQDYVADPYATLPEPVPGTAMVPPKISGYTTFSPGYYPQGLNMNDGENVVLEPGVYILDNGFKINGHANLTGMGVMFFIRTGAVDINGTGEIRLSPPDTGVYEGIQFFQARANKTEAKFNGMGLITGIDDPTTPGVDESTNGMGMLYFPTAKTYLLGTGQQFLTGLIADKIEVQGNGRKTVTGGYDGDDGADKVWLAE
jgi:Flp pilus assembly protein TadG